MASTTLAELERTLAAEARAGTISLDKSFLPARALALLPSNLPPLTDTVLLAATATTTVRIEADGAGVPTLWIEGAATSPAQEPLALAGVPAAVAIQQTTAGEANGYDLVLRLSLPAAWEFGSSLPPLGGLQPPAFLVTPHGQFLYFSTYTDPRPLPVFPGEPAPDQATLVTGLNYYAELELAGIFAQAEELLGPGQITVPLCGEVKPDPQQPELNLRAQPAKAKRLTLGILELGVPFVGIKTAWVKPEEHGEKGVPPFPNLLFYVGADIGIDPEQGDTAIGIELNAVFVDPEAGSFLLTLGAPPGEKLSLGSLAEKLLGTDEDTLKGAAGTLDTYLGSITLEGFSAFVTPTAQQPVQYLQAQIGTSPPWPIGGGGLHYELDLTFTWTLFLFEPQTSWSAHFEALLTLSEKLAFDIEVNLPQLEISGSEIGEVVLEPADLEKIFPQLKIPKGLASLSLTDFSVALAAGSSGSIESFSLYGVAGLAIEPFGTPVLALRSVVIALAVDTGRTPTQYTLNLSGLVIFGGSLELAGSATVSNVPGTKTVFRLHLVDETVGSMLGHLVHLVDPTLDVTLPSPWDRFLAISLDALVLEVDLTDGIVALTYKSTIDLEFLKLSQLGLAYTEASGNKPSSVMIEVEGEFLGVTFGTGGDRPPLAWNPINESPPAVPGKTSLLDLRYAGLGQHIGFSGEQPQTIPEVIKDLTASVVPVQPGQLPQFGEKPGELSFQPGSGWLVGADLTVMGTVSLAAIFNDPNLYGLRVSLAGEKAGSFAGLSFEILYRKVTDTIGVYHVELKLPTAMRTIEMGEVSLTLPLVVLDVYTNGNFRIDLGFPRGLDFSNSFCLQVFPFVGYGGFYFAVLDGATSTRVPQITNGSFHPVLEFGVGLSVGVGKTINAGILSGGISVTVVGIVEGVLAWFHPTAPAPEANFFALRGMIAVTGRLYAKIDFAIIQASLDVTAILTVTLQIESHQPIYIEASASVSVRVSVKIVFFTIHLSFSAKISASFTIGSASPTPWQVAPGSSHVAILEARGRRVPYVRAALPRGHRRALREALLAGTVAPITSWPAVCVFPTGIQKLPLWALTSFSKDDAGQPAALLLLNAESGGVAGAPKAFDQLMWAMLAWGIWAETGQPITATSTVSAEQLEDLRQSLGLAETVAAAFDPATLTAFLAANFAFDVNPASSANGETRVAAFPMVPELTLADTAGTKVEFASFNEVDQAYQANVRAYFQSLQVRFETPREPGDGAAAALAANPTETSIASLIFSQYFNMLLSQGVKAALDLLEALPYTTGSSPQGLAEIAAALGDPALLDEPLRLLAPNQDAEVLAATAVVELPGLSHQVRAGETPASIATELEKAGLLAPGGETYTAAALLAANAGELSTIFNPGVLVGYEGVVYTTQVGDTLELVAARLLVRIGGAPLLNGLSQLAAAVEALAILNPAFATPPTARIPAGKTVTLENGLHYTTVAGDSLALIAAYGVAVASHAISPEALIRELVALNKPAITEPNTPQPPGTVLKIPRLERATAPGDSVASIAETLVTGPAPVEASLLAVPASPQLLSPQAILATPGRYTVATNDKLSAIAAKLGIDLGALAGPAAATPGLFAATTKLSVEDVPVIGTEALLDALLAEGSWGTAAGMVSRFLLGGLRLPAPTDPGFAGLDAVALGDPETLAAIVTEPLYKLTGQQFGIAASPPSTYAITLSKPASGVDWLTIGQGDSVTYPLSAEELKLLGEIATTALDPQLQTATRLALSRQLPTRSALQRRITWQAAAAPPGLLPAGGGAPALWLFPEALLAAIAGDPKRPPLLYELGAESGAAPGTAPELQSYTWATLIDLTISRPETSGAAPAIADAYVVEGADDTGAALLQELQSAVAEGAAAELFLLYEPDPAGPSPSGLASDAIDAAATWALKTNLTTLTASGPGAREVAPAIDPTDVYAAGIGEAAEFLALLWEASITRSGGFYLNYANAAGGGLPGSVFGSGSTARLSLLAILEPKPKPAGTAKGTGPIMPFHNCAVVGDAIDPGSATVVAAPATHEVLAGESLTKVAEAFNERWGQSLGATDVATLNADLPQLLEVGATLTLPDQQPHEILYGDTFASVAAHAGVTIAALVGAGGNATAAILSPGALVQFSPGVLTPATTVPPGTVGFELMRADPDPDDQTYDELTPTQLVGSLFNLTAWSVAAGGGFAASGEGLPTTPIEAGPSWAYSQALAAAPFATSANGSASPALPAAAENPYNGIGAGAPGEATLALRLQDVYGNRQPLPSPWDAVAVPVGYYDDVVGLSAWPSLAVSYLVEGQAEVALALTMQQQRYVPSLSVPVKAARAAVAADLASYRRIHYQLAQPDLTFSLRTTLAVEENGEPREYPLARGPFLAFARAAYVQLAALATLAPVELAAAGMTVAAAAGEYGVTAAQLLEANQSQLYAALFGAERLSVPAIYTTVQDDTAASIAARVPGLTVAALASTNETVPLAAGAVLRTPARTQAVAAGERLADLALAARASVAGLAEANETRTDVLAKGTELTVGTKAYTVGTGDSLAHTAETLETTVAAVALANQYLPGLFLAGAQLQVDDVLAGPGDTLALLAAAYDGAGGVTGLAETNQELANLFAPATALRVGWEGEAKGPLPSDTLLTFAQANEVTVEQLAAANPSAAFATAAVLEVPAALEQTGSPRWCTYGARGGDTLAAVAALFGAEPADLAALNPDLPGLFADDQTVTDASSGASVRTVAEDSFASIAARFEAEHGVTLTVAQVAADVSSQPGLLLAGGIWICPPMRGDAYGANAAHSLAGLAGAYGIELGVLAEANAATLGLLAAGVRLAAPDWPPIVTGAHETLNSLVTRLAATGITATVAEVAAAVAGVSALAAVTAVPPPPQSSTTAIEPGFAAAAFQLRVEVTAARDGELVDPDFATAPAVLAATSTLAPEPDPGGEGALGLTEFATALEKAIPKLAVATGDAAVEDDPTAASSVWCVNFGNAAGPLLEYGLVPEEAAYFALPPLSRALMAGTVEVQPYSKGSGLGPAEETTFQAVDLDAWLNRFLEAVDVFLAPASAVPAYFAAPDAVKAVVKAKGELAEAISNRLENVLAGSGDDAESATPKPSAKAAIERMRQALLQRLGNAVTVSTLVQLPAGVTSPSADPRVAPRLSGRLTPAGSAPEDAPSSYSFSTAKLPLTDKSSTATFLFSAKAPAASSHVDVEVGFAVSEVELPDPTETIGEYEGSSWLRLVLPPQQPPAMKLEIPVPLRAYPSPVTLASQSAEQRPAGKPPSPADLLGWDFAFAYQHDDAEQDAALVELAFNPRGDDPSGTVPSSQLDLEAVFAALAQFTTIAAPLADDLAGLALLPPGTANPVTTTAVTTFATVVAAVAAALNQTVERAVQFEPPTETFYYQLVREADATSLTRLVINAVDPATGAPRPNPSQLWPKLWVSVDGGATTTPLTPAAPPTATQAVFDYPPDTPADASVEERFGFACGGGEASEPPAPATPNGVTLVAPRVFRCEDVDVLSRQSGRAGVAIWRNWSLLPTAPTNPNFVYQTPIARFPAAAKPALLATEAIELGTPSTPLAQALGEFLQALTTSRDLWAGEDELPLRLGCGYSYAVAASSAGPTPELAAVTPIFLVPSYGFHPAARSATEPADWDWTAPASFVSQVGAMADGWLANESPSRAGGAFAFDLTVYASAGETQQPLIHATTLRYELQR